MLRTDTYAVPLHGRVLGRLFGCGLALLATGAWAGFPETQQQTSGLSLRSSAPVSEATTTSSDTLIYRVRAGEVLIQGLPAEVSQVPVARYVLVEAPALSWLVDRSFFWRTLEEDRGRHAVRIAATFDAAPADTLTVQVVVE